MLDILILQKNIQKELKKLTKKLVKNLIMIELSSLFKKKSLARLKKKEQYVHYVLGNENELVFPIYVSDQKFEHSITLLLLIYDKSQHYVYIKDFNRFMFHKTRNKNKKWFCRSCLQFLEVKTY